MIYHYSITLTIVACLFNSFHGASVHQPIGTVVTCRNKIVNLTYTEPLPAISSGDTRTVSAKDTGLWTDCKLGLVISVDVKYFLSLTLSKANCHQGNFTKLSMVGNFVVLLGQPQKTFNFTIRMDDPAHVRRLDLSQKFFGYVTLPTGTDVPPNGNFTYTFSATKHKSNCEEVRHDAAHVDADLNVADLSAPLPSSSS